MSATGAQKTLHLSYGNIDNGTFTPFCEKYDVSSYEAESLPGLLKALSPDKGFFVAQLIREDNSVETALLGERVLTQSEMEQLAKTDEEAREAWDQFQEMKKRCDLEEKNCWGMSDQAVIVETKLSQDRLYHPTEPDVSILNPHTYEELETAQSRQYSHPSGCPAKPDNLSPS